MSKRQIIIVLGALIIAIALLSGLPASWNTALYVIIGIAIITVAYTTAKPARSRMDQSRSMPYVDAKNPVRDEAHAPIAEEAPVVPPLSVTDQR
jgi:type III secretory pathway component EscV